MNGELSQWEAATVHVASYGLHYGSGVFEEIRASIDGVELGVGSITEALRDEYLRCVRAASAYEPGWLEHVPVELAA